MKKEKKITIKEIATKAGVSITTVSHAINNTRYVKEETKKRILKIIKENKFQISKTAKSLRQQRSKLIGVIVPDIANVVFSSFIKKLEYILFRNGYSLTICNTNYEKESERNHIDILLSRDVDGIVLFPSGLEDEYYEEIRSEISNSKSFIVIKRDRIENTKVDTIITNVLEGFYDATNYLISNGHTKIAYIGSNLSRDSFEGFIKALRENNLKLNKNYYIEAYGFKYNDGYDAMEKIFKLNDIPTAVIAWNDILLIGALKSIYKKNLKVPRDISVIGCDDIEIDDFVFNGLNTLTFPSKKIAETAYEIIERNANKVHTPKIYKLSQELIIRNSVRKL